MNSLPAECTHSSFRDLLQGEYAFYNQTNYLETTRREFESRSLLPVTYTWNTENPIARIVKQILAIIIFPIRAYHALHAITGRILLQASNPTLIRFPKDQAHILRSQASLDGDWKFKRITIEVDNNKIDAMIMGKASTLGNGRWILDSCGTSEFYENKLLKGSDLESILHAVHGNGLVFNYPGVGTSSGMPNRRAMAKAYRAMLHFLEDEKNGIGAKEIIGYGYSIGGGVQGDALRNHSLKKNIKYVFLKSRTFSNLSSAVYHLTNTFLKLFVKITGWNLSSLESSRHLKAPEIIMQTARVDEYEELHDSSKIIDDGVIAAQSSLAKKLLDNPGCTEQKKLFLGIPERHTDWLHDPTLLAQKIEESLRA